MLTPPPTPRVPDHFSSDTLISFFPIALITFKQIVYSVIYNFCLLGGHGISLEGRQTRYSASPGPGFLLLTHVLP